jgi:hypothetical protein
LAKELTAKAPEILQQMTQKLFRDGQESARKIWQVAAWFLTRESKKLRPFVKRSTPTVSASGRLAFPSGHSLPARSSRIAALKCSCLHPHLSSALAPSTFTGFFHVLYP